MIPSWMLILLNTKDVGEFSYKGLYNIYIKGMMVEGEWVVSIRVDALPYFAWGCNGLRTGLNCSFNGVIRYYIFLVINQLTEYKAEGRTELLHSIKDYLE